MGGRRPQPERLPFTGNGRGRAVGTGARAGVSVAGSRADQPDASRWLLLAAPFYLNDFASIHVEDWRVWLLLDYLFVKALPIGLVGWWLCSGRLRGGAIGLGPADWGRALIVFLLALTAGVLLDQNAYALTAGMPGYGALGGMPVIDSPWLDWFDLTMGLLLVGVAEELVFRAWLAGALARQGVPAIGIVGASALAFGLIHWSGGAQVVLVTGVIGAVFMAFYLWHRSLPALALAHFGVNFVDFAGVVPRSWFVLV